MSKELIKIDDSEDDVYVHFRLPDFENFGQKMQQLQESLYPSFIDDDGKYNDKEDDEELNEMTCNLNAMMNSTMELAKKNIADSADIGASKTAELLKQFDDIDTDFLNDDEDDELDELNDDEDCGDDEPYSFEIAIPINGNMTNMMHP